MPGVLPGVCRQTALHCIFYTICVCDVKKSGSFFCVTKKFIRRSKKRNKTLVLDDLYNI